MTCRPVAAYHVVAMAERLLYAARDRHDAVARSGCLDNPDYERAVRCHERRFRALGRLAEALERQNGGDPR